MFPERGVCAMLIPARWWARRVSRMRRSRRLAELAGRSYWREDDARVIVEAWRQSGDPISGFAQRLGIDWRRVSRWARRLKDRPTEAVRFVPVQVANDRRDGSGGSIEIELDRRRVRVSPGFATDDLRRILAVLEERVGC
jgi:hypothetical protein